MPQGNRPRAGAVADSRSGAAADAPDGRDDPGWATVANALTVVRLLLLPPSVFLLLNAHSTPAVGLLVLFGVTDWIDGWVARRRDEVSRVGTVLDPLADRLGIASIMMGLTFAGVLPWWVTGGVLVTDVMVGLGWLLFRPPAARLTVTQLGKVRTALLMAGVVSAAGQLSSDSELFMVSSVVLLGSGVILHVAAGAGYVRQMRHTPEHRSTDEPQMSPARR